jgi:hypothetical protein
MEDIVTNNSAIEKFKTSLRGELIERVDPHYGESRKLYNGMVDKRPQLVARCVNAADIISSD